MYGIYKLFVRFLDEILGLFCVDVSLRGIFPILEDYVSTCNCFLFQKNSTELLIMGNLLHATQAVNRFMCYERYCASQSHRLKEIRMCT